MRITYQSRTHALHLHEYQGTIRIKDQNHPLQPGTVTLSPAHHVTRYDLPKPGRHWCIHFHTVRTVKPVVKLPLYVSSISPIIDFAGRMAHIASLHASSMDNIIAQTAASLALQELLLFLAYRQSHTTKNNPTSESQQSIDRLLELIQGNLDQTLRVETLAHKVDLSQNYLARHFKARMGMTIPAYILQARIQRAMLLLQTTNLPIKQIASQVGIPDAQHFNKQFRRLTGQSPSACRK